MQLITLRDIYNNSWKPNWNNCDEIKYCIVGGNNTITTYTFAYEHKILAFKTEKLRDEFLKNFRSLIEKAKYLI